MIERRVILNLRSSIFALDLQSSPPDPLPSSSVSLLPSPSNAYSKLKQDQAIKKIHGAAYERAAITAAEVCAYIFSAPEKSNARWRALSTGHRSPACASQKLIDPDARPSCR